MSSILHEDTFHGTKKGGRRKTVSKRRAYVNTPAAIAKKVLQIAYDIDSEKYMLAYSEAIKLAKQLSPRTVSMQSSFGKPR